MKLRSIKTLAGVELGPMKAYVLPSLPMGVEMVIGLDLVLKHGLTVGHSNGCSKADPSGVTLGAASIGVGYLLKSLKVEDSDFEANFSDGKWVVKWKWKEGNFPISQLDQRNYCVAKEDREAFGERLKPGLMRESS